MKERIKERMREIIKERKRDKTKEQLSFQNNISRSFRTATHLPDESNSSAEDSREKKTEPYTP